MQLNSLFKAIVINGMGKGFRRAGISLDTGTNDVEINVNQLKQMEADPNLTVDVLETVKESFIDAAQDAVLALAAAKLNVPLATVIAIVDLVSELRNNDELRHGFVESAVDTLKQTAIEEVANTAADFVADKLSDVLEDVVNGLDMSTADEFLHPFITIIDVLSADAPLAKKPTVKELTAQVENGGEFFDLTPTAAQRDEAWAWYQANVKVIDVEVNVDPDADSSDVSETNKGNV